jgi:hypothetical protein
MLRRGVDAAGRKRPKEEERGCGAGETGEAHRWGGLVPAPWTVKRREQVARGLRWNASRVPEAAVTLTESGEPVDAGGSRADALGGYGWDSI